MRASALAAIMMLLAAYALGIIAGVSRTGLSAGRGLPAVAAFWAVVTGGPIVLAIHALLGTLIIVTAVATAVRAAGLQHGTILVLALIALLCVVAAWVAGADLVSRYAAPALLAMAFGDAAAIACYAVIVFRT